MSEEEIIKVLEDRLENSNLYIYYNSCVGAECFEAIRSLLELYQKEKEKNKELEKYRGLYENEMLGYIAGYEDGKHHKLTATAIFAEENKQKRLEQMIKQNYISKDKIRELLHSYSINDKRFTKYLEELLEE